MMPYAAERFVLGTLIVGVLGLAVWLHGWHRGYDAATAEWQRERAAIEAQARAAADALRAEGEHLRAALAEARATVRVEYVETIRYVVKHASPTRVAIRRDITAELNRASRIRETVERPAGAQPAPPAPVSEGGTSELAAAEWIANARARYAECREQVAALAAWAKKAGGTR